jgi:predicted ester cyclase
MKVLISTLKVLISALVLALLILGLTASSSARTPSVSDQNKAIVRGATAAINARQYAALSDYFAPDMIDHDATLGQAAGLPGFVHGMRIKYAGFPDWVNVDDEMIAEGDQVATHWSGRGTQSGMLLGLPSIGTKLEMFGMRWYKLSNGKIVETWNVFGLFRQIGATPQQR